MRPYLGHESLVKGGETLLAGDSEDGRPGPVVLGHLSSDLGGVLDSALDDVHGRVQDGSDGATDGTRDEVVGHLGLLVLRLGEQLPDLEDAAKVAGVPQNVAPHGALQALVQAEDALLADRLGHAVQRAGVLGSLVLHADLDELEGDDDNGLGGTGGGAREDREGLVHLGLVEDAAVDLAPLIVGGELGSTLGGLHQDGGRDSSVQAGESGWFSVSMDWYRGVALMLW